MEGELGDGSVRLQIMEQPSEASIYMSTLFEPQRETPPSCDGDDGHPRGGSCPSMYSCHDTYEAPEKKLTLFALRLAILEKAASGLGALGFIWATVVLLGGFAITLEKKDFWFITVILLIEGTRIFSRSHELEWQQQATWSLADAGRSSFRALKSSFRSLRLAFRPFSIDSARIASDVCKTGEPPRGVLGRRRRTWQSADVPLLPYAGWVFLSRNISRVFYWLQLLSASACVSLSLMRLIEQDFGAVRAGDTDKTNRKSALNIFYGLALAEALMFLAEKAFWEYKASHQRLLERVNAECQLGPSGMVSIKRFFYDAYSRCVNGSIFDGLKMDLVAFAEQLLVSSSRDEQLIGARILISFATSRPFADSTLRKIGTSTAVIERLIDMLNWKNANPAEEEIRRSAATIVSKLAGKKQNALRLAGIPGAMESISSLLYTGRSVPRPGEICGAAVHAAAAAEDRASCYDLSAFNLLGLLILKKLAHDHDNGDKMGNARGLLDRIIDFTSMGNNGLRTESQIKAVKRSLQVVKMLASTTGHTGRALRQEISEIVFTVSNIREILRCGEQHMELQKLGIGILTSLAMDDEGRERIGSTGGMIRELLRIFFFRPTTPAPAPAPAPDKEENAVTTEAGEALSMLALESRRNCERILKQTDVVERLVAALDEPALRIDASRILHNLCAYAGSQCYLRLRPVTHGITTVLNAIMVEKSKLLEVSLGLTSQMCKFMSAEEFSGRLYKSGISESDFVINLIRILNKYNHPSVKVPRIRRFVIELAIWMMRADSNKIKLFISSGMEKELRSVSETTSELECFNVFSGSVGLSPHDVSLCSLVDTALLLMGKS
ncbi:uncharacterized protein LOC109719190 [Ananas comosus]|uniref:Uncharacterized protein LOC109719190 n=1 Tax=Ananas comosus TaxID=4615 RepID=A0A6P5FZ35_ANACO|nr:uncharacterized protein LOC109719190 [Ananas comosus]